MDDPRLRLALEWLQAKRRHVIGTLDGLDEADLRRGVLPSGWSLLGLVQHLALDVERVWLRRAVGGEDVPLQEGGAWRVPEDRSVEDVLATYRAEAVAADAAVLARHADDPLRWWFDGDPAPYATVLEALQHVLVETATHAGHGDAAREVLDGTQRLVLD